MAECSRRLQEYNDGRVQQKVAGATFQAQLERLFTLLLLLELVLLSKAGCLHVQARTILAGLKSSPLIREDAPPNSHLPLLSCDVFLFVPS
jgi:hypothetical protein